MECEQKHRLKFAVILSLGVHMVMASIIKTNFFSEAKDMSFSQGQLLEKCHQISFIDSNHGASSSLKKRLKISTDSPDKILHFSSSVQRTQVKKQVDSGAFIEKIPLEDFPAALKKLYSENPHPNYPGLSLRFREEGTVYLLIHPEKVQSKVVLERSSGFPRLDQEALRIVSTWSFLCLEDLRLSEKVMYILPVQFALNH